jgi:hypothetical protein
MKTIQITAGHTGYPNGKRRHFAKGEEVEVADAYADLIIGKQLGREKPAASPAKAVPATKAKD